MAADATFAALPGRVSAVEGRVTAVERDVTDLRVNDASQAERIGSLHESIERLTGVMDKVFWAIIGVPFAAVASFVAAVLSHAINLH